MNLGITATQTPGPDAERLIREHLAQYDPAFTVVIQGCCIGVDTIVAMIARDMGFEVGGIVPANTYKVDQRALQACHWLHHMNPGTSFMQRNDEIILRADKLAAFPKTATEQLRSGTWATIRRGWKKRIPVYIISVGGN
jgi:hypothetical protein